MPLATRPRRERFYVPPRPSLRRTSGTTQTAVSPRKPAEPFPASSKPVVVAKTRRSPRNLRLSKNALDALKIMKQTAPHESTAEIASDSLVNGANGSAADPMKRPNRTNNILGTKVSLFKQNQAIVRPAEPKHGKKGAAYPNPAGITQGPDLGLRNLGHDGLPCMVPAPTFAKQSVTHYTLLRKVPRALRGSMLRIDRLCSAPGE